MTSTGRRFPIRFTGAGRAMAVLGFTRRSSYVEVRADELHVRMSWGFTASAPRAAIQAVADDPAPVWGWGAHGWRGVWLVNGSSSGIVRVDLNPRAKGRVLGIPVKPRALRVAVDDPEGLKAALGST